MKKELANGQVLDDPRVTPALILALQRHAKEPAIRGALLQDLAEVATLEKLALQINAHYKELLLPHGWILEDFKFEVGVLKGTRDFMLIDEISPDCSRIRDQDGGSLTKDLFRENRAPAAIYQRYSEVLEAVQCL
jgi:phosphoribosylaminoimidazole-succinocarboxamide synthase